MLVLWISFSEEITDVRRSIQASLKGFKFIVKMEKQCVKALQLTLFHLLKRQNGAYQYNQLARYIVDTYPIHVVAISSW